MTGIADMAHHHANGADTGCLGNQPSGAGRRQQHGCRTGRVIAQFPDRLLLTEAVNHVSAVKRAGGLLNQVARVLNTTRSPVDVEIELRAALRAVEASSIEVSEFLADARNSM